MSQPPAVTAGAPEQTTSSKTGSVRNRPRGHSTSSIRNQNVLASAPVGASGMARVVSSPITSRSQVSFPSPPPSLAPTISSSSRLPFSLSRTSSTRGRALSTGSGDKSRSSSRGGTIGRSKSPPRDFSFSLSSLRLKKTARSPPSGDHTPSSVHTELIEEGSEAEEALSYSAKWRNLRTSWWQAHSPSWIDKEKRREVMSPEQVRTFTKVKERVALATKSLLPSSETVHEAADLAAEAAHEALTLSADVLQFAPVVGLAEAARVLANIWDAVQLVDLNQRACLRLTERCANILISVREEIAQADGLVPRSPLSTHSSPPTHQIASPVSPPVVAHSWPASPYNAANPLDMSSSPSSTLSDLAKKDFLETPRQTTRSGPGFSHKVGNELQVPMDKLISAFNDVLELIEKLNSRPFLKRYLKREEIQQEIVQCDALLTDALSLFSVSIQIRTLKQVLQNEELRHANNDALLERIFRSSPLQDQITLPPYEPDSGLSAASPAPASGLLLQNLPERESEGAQTDDALNALDMNLKTLEPVMAATETAPLQPPFSTPPVVPENLSQDEIMDRISRYSLMQIEQAAAHDAAYLRRLLTSALATNDDMQMIKVLQVSREEMPEALKALQRALEVEVDKEHEDLEAIEESSVDSTQGILEGISGIKDKGKGRASRQNTFDSNHSRTSTTSKSSVSRSRTSTVSKASTTLSHASRDTLDREFLESGIETLRRLSLRAGQPASALSLPPWTITRYEVDRNEQIGVGSFSSVWRGTYKGRTVAVKVLAPWTPKEMFVREVAVWCTLKHRNVLELIGASATCGSDGLSIQDCTEEAEPPEGHGPWFFVSRYYERGSLVKWMKCLDKSTWSLLLDDVSEGVLRMIHEISQGMAYLHGRGVLHGDLKCANILIDDGGHCILSDFGQSEMRDEVYRLSGAPVPRGTLRWQAPEVMSGQSQLTQEVDIYAFAMSCVEVLTKGMVPWPLSDDDAVRHLVLKDDARPEIRVTRSWSASLSSIIHQCWQTNPASRPPFSVIDARLSELRRQQGWNGLKTVSADDDVLAEEDEVYDDYASSPSMYPSSLPLSLPPEVTYHDLSMSSEGSYATAKNGSSHQELVSETTPTVAEATEVENERRYRMLLQHEYHHSLVLPLWTPSPLAIGAVGYHARPSGSFVTLLNAFHPIESSGGKMKDMHSLYHFGTVPLNSQKFEKRSVARRGIDTVQSWINRGKTENEVRRVSRQYSAPLRTGHRTAHLFTETATYRFMTDLEVPKEWFRENAGKLISVYGQEHAIQKEDLMLVIGTLDAANHALFVSHCHPDGQVNFNIFSSTRPGQPWGELTTSAADISCQDQGPVYNEELSASSYAGKVSLAKNSLEQWDTVLVARLRFPPDRDEPTSKL